MQLWAYREHEHLSQVSSFLHLHPQQMFLTICGHTLTTWNFKVGSNKCSKDRQEGC
jgi:hypothetical protein